VGNRRRLRLTPKWLVCTSEEEFSTGHLQAAKKDVRAATRPGPRGEQMTEFAHFEEFACCASVRPPLLTSKSRGVGVDWVHMIFCNTQPGYGKLRASTFAILLLFTTHGCGLAASC